MSNVPPPPGSYPPPGGAVPPSPGPPAPGFPQQGPPAPGYPAPGYPAPGNPAPGYAPPGYPAGGMPPMGYVPPKKSNAGKTILIIGGVLLGMCLLGGVGLVALGSTVTTTTTRPGQIGVGGGAGRSADEAFPIGTSFEVAKGWKVTVVSAEINANATMAAESSIFTPDSGKQYVIVRLKIENVGKDPDTVFTNVDLNLLSKTGATINTTFASLPDRLDITTQLQPGGTVTGSMVYEVPKTDLDTLVLLAEPAFTIDELKDQRFFRVK